MLGCLPGEKRARCVGQLPAGTGVHVLGRLPLLRAVRRRLARRAARELSESAATVVQA